MSDEADKKRLLPPEKAREIDHQLRSQVATATRGVSPVDVAAAVVDWAGHLVLSPGKLLSLAESVARNGVNQRWPASFIERTNSSFHSP